MDVIRALVFIEYLNLDGEFGPVTQAAVLAWQKSNKLPENGEINLDAWKLLGLSAGRYRPAG